MGTTHPISKIESLQIKLEAKDRELRNLRREIFEVEAAIYRSARLAMHWRERFEGLLEHLADQGIEVEPADVGDDATRLGDERGSPGRPLPGGHRPRDSRRDE